MQFLEETIVFVAGLYEKNDWDCSACIILELLLLLQMFYLMKDAL